MGQRVSQPVSPVLEELQGRFATWRSTGRKGERIPEALWEAAAVAARELGVNRVSRAAGLDYTRLKRRVAGSGAPQAETSPTATGPVFVELPTDSVASRSAWSSSRACAGGSRFGWPGTIRRLWWRWPKRSRGPSGDPDHAPAADPGGGGAGGFSPLCAAYRYAQLEGEPVRG